MIDGEVQLEGGHHDYDGRVQVCQNSRWRYLCLPSLSEDFFLYIDKEHTVFTCMCIYSGNEHTLTECNTI